MHESVVGHIKDVCNEGQLGVTQMQTWGWGGASGILQFQHLFPNMFQGIGVEPTSSNSLMPMSAAVASCGIHNKILTGFNTLRLTYKTLTTYYLFTL